MTGQESQDVTIEQLQARIQVLENQKQKWVHLAGSNHLTDLPNALMFYHIILPAEMKKARESQARLACVLISINGMGAVNQNCGRSVGDRLIGQTGAFLRQRIKPGDRLCHPDGVNFVILMPGATEGRYQQIASAIRADLRKAIFTVGDRVFTQLTCSMGMSMLDVAIPEADIPERMQQLYMELNDRVQKSRR